MLTPQTIVPGIAGWLGATVALPVVASAGGVVGCVAKSY